MTETRELRIKAARRNIPRIIAFVTEAAEAAGLNEDEVFHCQLSVDEAATNVIEHAYGEGEEGQIVVNCVIRSASLIIKISDQGQPFDPMSIPEPVFSADPAEMEPGGLGLTIIRRMMDEVVYESEDGVNTLKLIKRRAGMPPEELTQGVLSHQVRPGTVVIMPIGRMSSGATPELSERLNAAIAIPDSALVIDLSRMSYISSRGLKILLAAWRELSLAGRLMILSAPPLRIRAILETIGFNQVFTIADSLDKALSLIETDDNARDSASEPVTGEER